MKKITLVDNTGTGYNDKVELPSHIVTVKNLFDWRIPGGNPAHYRVRVNASLVPVDYELKDDDRVSISPVNVKGA